MHPNIDVRSEAGGSTKMARMISESGQPADIMASADAPNREGALKFLACQLSPQGGLEVLKERGQPPGRHRRTPV